MIFKINTTLFGYSKHETDNYIVELQKQISDLKHKNSTLSSEIQQLYFKNSELVAELEVKK